MEPQPALTLKDVSITFGGVEALRSVYLTVSPGEIHGLIGQNGSGKSSLVKILTGIYSPSAGSARVFGVDVPLPVVRPQRYGIAVIQQDLGLAEDLTVLENIDTPVNYDARLLGPVRPRRTRLVLTPMMKQLGIELDLNTKVASLAPSERTFVAILRAMRVLRKHGDRSLLILDEPTTSLAAPDAVRVIDLMRRVAMAGNAVIFISHRLSEVVGVCDAVTVLRDGKVVLSEPTTRVTQQSAADAILGRRLESFYPPKVVVDSAGEVVLKVCSVFSDRLRGLSFSARRGEVVGFTGLTGMGQEDLPRILAGDLRPRSGSVEVLGKSSFADGPGKAKGLGVAMVPGNRARDGGWLDATAQENVTLPALRSSNRFWLSQRRDFRRANDLMSEVDVVPALPKKRFGDFSGGNQQKIVMAKWLQTRPVILVLDEPTQGVDAGAKHDILKLVLDVARRGGTVIMVSGDYEQLAHTCNRVIVLQDGTRSVEIDGPALTERALVLACNSSPDLSPRG